jgi:hypothetical protein
MITQVEIDVEGHPLIFWLSNDPFENPGNPCFLKAGMEIQVESEEYLLPQHPFRVNQTFVSLPEGTILPPKARVGTVIGILADMGFEERLRNPSTTQGT